jgi:hypothetical protein
MLESNLVGGSQDYRARPLVHGQSVTDACLSWEKTAPVLALLAEAVRARRLKRQGRPARPSGNTFRSVRSPSARLE